MANEAEVADNRFSRCEPRTTLNPAPPVLGSTTSSTIVGSPQFSLARNSRKRPHPSCAYPPRFRLLVGWSSCKGRLSHASTKCSLAARPLQGRSAAPPPTPHRRGATDLRSTRRDIGAERGPDVAFESSGGSPLAHSPRRCPPARVRSRARRYRRGWYRAAHGCPRPIGPNAGPARRTHPANLPGGGVSETDDMAATAS